MLSEEEKKAIKILGTFEFRQKTINYNKIDIGDVDSTKIVLNLITKLQKENEEKDKQIDLMAEWISERCFYIDEYINSCEVIQDSCYKEKNCKDCLKQYFANKVNSKIQ